jgi:hypothetical protein
MPLTMTKEKACVEDLASPQGRGSPSTGLDASICGNASLLNLHCRRMLSSLSFVYFDPPSLAPSNGRQGQDES